MADKVLFEIPIDSTKGRIVGTEVKPQVYLITFTSPPDNRLTTSFCQAFILALDIIETRHEPGVVITTSGLPKFYSNGLDLEHASWTKGFFPQSLYALFKRLITYPMPTIALINGHAFAGGFMVAMYHDYRIMNPSKGYLCLNELELGVPLSPAMLSVFRQRTSAQTLRSLVLEAARLKAPDAQKEGIVDWLGGLDEALAHVDELKLVGKAQTGLSGKRAYAILKREMWRDTIDYLDNFNVEHERNFNIANETKRGLEQAEDKVEAFEATKAKL